MTSHPSHTPVSALRERMIEDMIVRGIGAKTRHDYVRHVRTFSAFIGRAPNTTTAEPGFAVGRHIWRGRRSTSA